MPSVRNGVEQLSSAQSCLRSCILQLWATFRGALRHRLEAPEIVQRRLKLPDGASGSLVLLKAA
eukprot:10312136-Alexandrium_andersonii.AAC.1